MAEETNAAREVLLDKKLKWPIDNSQFGAALVDTIEGYHIYLIESTYSLR